MRTYYFNKVYCTNNRQYVFTIIGGEGYLYNNKKISNNNLDKKTKSNKNYTN